MNSQQLEELFADWLVEEPPPPHVGPMVRAEVERVRRLENEEALPIEHPTIAVRRKRHIAGRSHPLALKIATGLVAASLILLVVGSVIVRFAHPSGTIEPTPPLRAAVPVVSDVSIGDPALPAIARVSSAGAMHIYDDGAFRPDAPVLRVEMAAISVRASGLTLIPGPPVTAPVADDELRRSYDTLVSLTLVNGAYAPTDDVLRIQVVSFIARTMVKAGRWSPVMIDDPAVYPDVLPESGHRLDLLTYMRNAGAIPGLLTTQSWPGFDQVADRGWVAQIVAPLVPPAAFAPVRAMQVPLSVASLAIVESRRGTKYHRG